MAPKAKAKKLKESDVDDLVMGVMQKHNRPFNLTILMATLNTVGKKQLQTSLDSLSSDGKLTAKEFGKAKLYWIPQETMPSVSADELKELDAQTTSLREEIKSIQAEVSSLESEIKSLDSALTEEEIDKRIAQTEEDNETLTAKVKNIQENTVMIDKDSFDQAQKLLKIAQAEWKKRKRLCKEIVDTISEQSGQKYFAFCDQLGLELDAEDIVLKEQQKANQKKRKTREAPAPKKPAKKQKKKEEEEEEEEEEDDD